MIMYSSVPPFFRSTSATGWVWGLPPSATVVRVCMWSVSWPQSSQQEELACWLLLPPMLLYHAPRYTAA